MRPSSTTVLFLACTAVVFNAHAEHKTFRPDDDVNRYLLAKGRNLTSVQVTTQVQFDDLIRFLTFAGASRHALKAIKASGPGITQLPYEIGRITSLNSLDISNTEIAVLPNEVGLLDALTSLDISGTLITHLPRQIVYLTALRHFKCDPAVRNVPIHLAMLNRPESASNGTRSSTGNAHEHALSSRGESASWPASADTKSVQCNEHKTYTITRDGLDGLLRFTIERTAVFQSGTIYCIQQTIARMRYRIGKVESRMSALGMRPADCL
ncbi:unnamed protein product (mitochondrion) [Plasmodiophora brassicae]|uniref:Uncharacterized protein n=1 Tax=Plasmodiophora brassicae TaxID=37360 RepID=A0A0G4IQ00_PLABS|nr:hypothetical protein PBRA_000571 [Plasmodiophora brassicae]SPQ97536.1 unnamed protein product [Plasmodiophora brassicae]